MIVAAAFTQRGAKVAARIAKRFGGTAYARPQDAGGEVLAIENSIVDWAGERFSDSECIVFVGAAGIAVRAIAPHVSSKTTDPAVLVVDEGARFVISLISGHIGGANDFARRVAAELGAQAVITTATDGRGLWAVDDWAREKGYEIENPEYIVKISSALLDGLPVCVSSDAPISGRGAGIPAGVAERSEGELGVWISPRTLMPYAKTLSLRPKVLTLGMGCKRGTSLLDIDKAIKEFLHTHGYSELSVARIASIDLKADEPALIAIASLRGWELALHTREELENAHCEGGFTPSQFVRSVTGVDNVCERAAALHGKLLVRKNSYPGVTAALSCADWEVEF